MSQEESETSPQVLVDFVETGLLQNARRGAEAIASGPPPIKGIESPSKPMTPQQQRPPSSPQQKQQNGGNPLLTTDEYEEVRKEEIRASFLIGCVIGGIVLFGGYQIWSIMKPAATITKEAL